MVSVDPAKLKDNYVARLSVLALRNLALFVQPNPLPDGPPGHAVIPELTWAAYSAHKEHWETIFLRLALLASADIVHRPGRS